MRCASGAGGTDGIPATRITATTSPANATAYVAVRPIASMRTPAIAGPTTSPRLLYRPVSAAAAGSCSSGTSRGTSDRTAPAPSENDDHAASESTKTSAALSTPKPETATSAPVESATPPRLPSSSRRRSWLSASAPPTIVSVTSGMNCTIASSPTARFEPVRRYTCTDVSTGSIRHAT